MNPSNRRPDSGAGNATTQPLDDADARQLLLAAKKYDDRALARIYQLYADRIFRYISFRVGDRGRAEELTGEVFLRLLENVANFRLGPSGHALALTGWIYRIAHNLIVDEYRHQKVRGEVDALSDGWEQSVDPVSQEELHLTRADLQMALRQLTGEQQTVIQLRFDEGMTSGEIAQLLGKTETAVKALQRRALAALARHLAPNTPLRA